MRAARAVIVIPSLFALTIKVIGNEQLATFAAFGGFATLVLAGFGGTRWDKARSHLALAAGGVVLIAIGTAVSSSTPLAAVVTLAVAFVVLFAGILGPNAANGATSALVAYVLSAATPGTPASIPSRVGGWLLASAAGTIAVIATSPSRRPDRLRAAISACASSLADELEALAGGRSDRELQVATVAATDDLRAAFTAAPYRPIGLGVPDQAVGNLVEGLDWCTSLVGDAVAGGGGPAELERPGRRRAAGSRGRFAAPSRAWPPATKRRTWTLRPWRSSGSPP